ncbi:FadR/GntR family transcriptional regulator [Mesorhizobium sp. PUT5]|uniref:FadR/GntR family transcriptional regulator n=1 Tax=Mesorhizobium sp. PUT5 TaxID=3454629 RepID=UPI003FA49EEB
MMNESQGPSGRPQRNLRQKLVDSLGEQIVGGTLKPGEALPPEDLLLKRYGVSRTVLREAINVLSGKGLLKARPRLGTVVQPRIEWSQLDPDVLSWLHTDASPPQDLRSDLEDLMKFRWIIEPQAAALAAESATREDIAAILAACEAMENAGDSVEAFFEADLAFHVACLHAAHNRFLLPVAHVIRTAMVTSLRVTNRDPAANRSVSAPLHFAILHAIISGSSKDAAAAMERHLKDTEARQVAAWQETQAPNKSSAR